MPYIPVPNVLMAELIYNWDGQVCENVLHYTSSILPFGAGDPLLLANNLVALWNTNIKVNASSNLSLTGVTVTDLTTATGSVVQATTGLPVVGTNVSGGQPNNVTCVITKRTAKRGRSYRGRLYQAGLCLNQVTANLVHSATLTAMLTAWGTFRTFTVSGVTFSMVVISRQHGGVITNPGTFEPVTGFTSDGVLDSQRRRLPGRGA